MTTIQVNGHSKPDGTLEISVLTGLPESDVEVLLVVQPMVKPSRTTNGGWPPGFFERTAGRWQGTGLRRSGAGHRASGFQRGGP